MFVRYILSISSVALCASCSRYASESPPLSDFDNQPFSVILDVRAPMGNGFRVSIDPAGETKVEGQCRGSSVRTRLDAKTQAELRHSTKEAAFFALPSIIGQPIVDGTEVNVTVVLGKYSHTVRVYSGWVASSSIDRQEVERITLLYKSVLDAVRGNVSHVLDIDADILPQIVDRVEVPKKG